MKASGVGFLAFGFLCMMSLGAVAVEKEGKKVEPLCPVMGSAIDKDVSIDYEGGKVCFCCAGCVAKFKADTTKYAIKANQQLVVTGQTKQIACPLTGGKFDTNKTSEIAGLKVAFCCDGCRGKLAKMEEDKQNEVVFGKNFKRTFEVKKAPQREQKKG